MTAASHSFSLLKSPWDKTLHRLVSQVEENIMLVSPFIKRSKTDQILSHLQKRGVDNSLRVVVLTDLRPESALNGSTDLEALVQLGSNLPKFDLTHLPSLHAKVYVADRSMAIITSGNLTDSGVSGNLEYGVVCSDETVVREIRQDFESYARLGAKVSSEDIIALLEEMRELKDLFKKAQRTIRSQARRAFKEKLEATHVQLMRHRAKGKTTHAILSETILFLLAKGPLRTIELHPLIQRLHPDICDDSVDRVIDGVHFGKKWKHYVRNAQQSLKRDRRIRYDGERWHLVP
jgi:phosphatidylserine/phosphatidylglycerophosphate/cardiolipin synthase-like enzyme